MSNTHRCIVHATCYNPNWGVRPMSTPASWTDAAERDCASECSQHSEFQSLCFFDAIGWKYKQAGTALFK